MLALIAVHGLVVAAVAAAVGWTHSKPRPCLRTFRQVREGMTRTEVEGIVGPPGDYVSPQAALLPRGRGERIVGEKVWATDDATLQVGFSGDGLAQQVIIGLHSGAFRISRSERIRSWVVTGYDVMPFHASVPGPAPYDLGVFRNILTP